MEQKYMPEGFHFVEISSSYEERLNELNYKMEKNEIVSAKVTFADATGKFAILDLGANITGWISSFKISPKRKLSVIKSLSKGDIINVKLTDFNNEKKSFTCDRLKAIDEAKKWQNENYKEGDILIAKITAIIDTGVFIDIGSGNIIFLSPKEVSKYYITDLNRVFHINQFINVQILGYSEEYNSFQVSYLKCPQFGLSIDTTIPVVLETQDCNGKWIGYLKNDPNQIAIFTNHIQNMVCRKGDIFPGRIIYFSQGIPILRF